MNIHMQTIPAHGFSEYSKIFRKHSLQLVLYSVSYYEYVIVILRMAARVISNLTTRAL